MTKQEDKMQQRGIQQDQRCSTSTSIIDDDDVGGDSLHRRNNNANVSDCQETHQQQQQQEEEEEVQEPPPRKRARMTTMTDTSSANPTASTRTAPPHATAAAAAAVTHSANGTKQPSHRKKSSKILQNVIACLSGLPYEEKEYYHQLIMKLGGKYTRNLISTENTHLIVGACSGTSSAKYELAMQCSNIAIVTPEWLDICYKTQSYINENKYSLKKDDNSSNNNDDVVVGHVEEDNNNNNEEDDTNNTITTTSSTTRMENSLDQLLLLPRPTKNLNGSKVVKEDENDECMMNNNRIITSRRSNSNNKSSTMTTLSSLFVSCHFLLIGFDDDDDDDDDDNNNGKKNGGATTTSLSFKTKLCKLIRRGQGTIYWDIHPKITHIIVHYHHGSSDENDNNEDNNMNGYDVLRNAVMIVSKNHANLPKPVSPLWIIESYRNNSLQPTYEYPPIDIAEIQSKTTSSSTDGKVKNLTKHSVSSRSNGGTSTIGNASTTARDSATTTSTTTSTSRNIFRGCMFALMRIAPPSYAVDYDTKTLEQSIKRHGGQMVSLKLLDALRIDVARSSRNASRITSKAASVPSSQRQDQSGSNATKKTCYVVCWGQIITQTHLALNPIISQLQRHKLCNVVLVTPIWLQTSIDVQKQIPPHRFPILYTPQPWLIHRYNCRNGCHDDSRNMNDKKLMTNASDLDLMNRKRLGNECDEKATKQMNSESNKSKPKTVANAQEQDLCISVTGFSNSERVAIRKLLSAMGVEYDGDMGTKCTHLICKEAVSQAQQLPGTGKDTTEHGVSSKKSSSETTTKAAITAARTSQNVVGGGGPKLERAMRSGIPVAPIDWLYQLARTGNVQ